MSNSELALQHILSRWQFDPARFFREALGVTPSNQQEEGCKLVGDMFKAKYDKSLDKPLTKKQKDLAGKLGVAIRSGHGSGKDYFLAGIFLWLLTCYPADSRGLATAPNYKTLTNVLWTLFRGMIARSKFMDDDRYTGWLSRHFEIQGDKLIVKDSNGQNFVEARTATVRGGDDGQGEALAGRHSEFQIQAIDEASGVPDGVFRPIEGAQSGRVNITIMIGNPTRGSGYFHDAFFKSSAFWATLHWDVEQSNLDQITKGATDLAGSVERYIAKYGRNSNAFRVRIKGDFPVAEADVLIPYVWIERAIGRELIPAENDFIAMGVDVAYMGKDRSVICMRHGPVVKDLHVFQGIDTMSLVGWCIKTFNEAAEEGNRPSAIFVDSIGLGSGVYSRLKEQGYPAYAVVVSEKANDETAYVNKRNELWFNLRKAFEDGMISLPTDCEELIDELSAMRVSPPDSSGRFRVMSKAEMRKSIGVSCDHADALCLTYAMGNRYTSGEGGMYWEEDAWLEKHGRYRPVNPVCGY